MSIHLFTTPKPWKNQFAAIQHCALKSWTQQLDEPFANIWLLGDEEGTQQAANQQGVHQHSKIETNKWNTPLVSSIFSIIDRLTPANGLACYINTDIVIPQNFTSIVNEIARQLTDNNQKQWLFIGKRTDIDIQQQITITPSDVLAKKGNDHGWEGIDYFVFPAGTFKFVHPFALGKFVWDQWLVGNAFRRGIPVVDCSTVIKAMHLNSQWYFQGQPTSDREAIAASEEGTRNRSFDHYQRNILTGSTHIATDINGKIRVKRKSFIVES